MMRLSLAKRVKVSPYILETSAFMTLNAILHKALAYDTIDQKFRIAEGIWPN